MQKTLTDRATLELVVYTLKPGEAEALGRPVGSQEIVLSFKGRYDMNTAPRASWYLGEGDFKKLYNKIRNENDFERVAKFLREEVNSPQDSQKFGSFLDTL